MKETIIIISIVLLTIGILTLNRNQEKRKLRKLAAKRSGLSKVDYIQYFERQGFPRLEIETLYDRLKDYLSLDSFQLHPEDDIHEDYAVTDLDDIELIDQIFDSLGIPKPGDEDYNDVDQKFKILNAAYILTLIQKVKEKNTAHNKT